MTAGPLDLKFPISRQTASPKLMYVHIYNVNVLKDILHGNRTKCNDFIILPSSKLLVLEVRTHPAWMRRHWSCRWCTM